MGFGGHYRLVTFTFLYEATKFVTSVEATICHLVCVNIYSLRSNNLLLRPRRQIVTSYNNNRRYSDTEVTNCHLVRVILLPIKINIAAHKDKYSCP